MSNTISVVAQSHNPRTLRALRADARIYGDARLAAACDALLSPTTVRVGRTAAQYDAVMGEASRIVIAALSAT